MNRTALTRVAALFLVSLLLITGVCLFDDTQSTAEAASIRSRKRARSSRARSSRARRASRRTLQRRTISKRRVPSRARRAGAPIPGTYPIAPDQIEVIEHNTVARQSAGRSLTDLPRPAVRARMAPASGETAASELPTSSRRRVSTRIDSGRVIEIQNALRERGIYEGEPSGVYDESTIESMRQFQLREKINATGYPTAHALKRLGLAR
ncbi:MAG: hypothetical protein RIR52_446 [Acidobacteriota bacterium]